MNKRFYNGEKYCWLFVYEQGENVINLHLN